MIALRALFAVLLACFQVAVSNAGEPVEVKVGDTVILEMKGEQAKKYCTTIGSELPSSGSVFVTCMVASKVFNKVELKHTLLRGSFFSVLKASIDESLISESFSMTAEKASPKVADFSVPKPKSAVSYVPVKTFRATADESSSLRLAPRRTWLDEYQAKSRAIPKD